MFLSTFELVVSTKGTASLYASTAMTIDMHAISAMRCEVVRIGRHLDLRWTQTNNV